MMRANTNDVGLSAAALVGAAGGAIAITAAAERFAVKRQAAALGGAAIAFAASRATSTTARSLLLGAAVAGLGIALVDYLRALRHGAAPTLQLPRPPLEGEPA